MVFHILPVKYFLTHVCIYEYFSRSNMTDFDACINNKLAEER